jgi:WD40 repeat protein
MLNAPRMARSALLCGIVFGCLPGASLIGAQGTDGQRRIPESYTVSAGISSDGRKAATVLGAGFGDALGTSGRIRIWDLSDLKQIASTEVLAPEAPNKPGTFMSGYGLPGPAAGAPKDVTTRVPYAQFIQFLPKGDELVYSDSYGYLHLIELGTMREKRAIKPDLHPDRELYGPVQMEISPRGDRIALASSGLDPILGLGTVPATFQGGELQVYDLNTGTLLWRARFANIGIGGIAWSPDASSLAMTLVSSAGASKTDNLVVLDANSGRILSKFKTGDAAAPVCYGPGNEIFTATVHYTFRNTRNEPVKVWDARTGQLTRKIEYAGRDIHDLLRISQDGRVLIGYVGREGSQLDVLDMTRHPTVLDERFAVWDARNGRLMATSPDLKPEAPSQSSGLWSHVQLQLSSDGSRALFFWRASPVQPTVFNIPEQSGL